MPRPAHQAAIENALNAGDVAAARNIVNSLPSNDPYKASMTSLLGVHESGSVKIVDNLPQFKRSLYSVMDDAIKEAARDTLINAKNKAPFRKGQLRANSDFYAIGNLQQRVSFWMEYARFQEFGGDSKRIIRHYSTSGTGKAYLKTSGDEQAKKLSYTLRKHATRARV